MDNFKYYFLLLDFTILFVNFILINIKYKIFNFKNVDLHFLIFNKYSYKNISDSLNSKLLYNFNLNNKKNNKPINITKKKIKLFFINFKYSAYQKKQIVKIQQILSKKFDISINSSNPDYLIYNVFGCEHLNKKYSNAIKIAYYTEYQLPDFSLSDYAVGQANLNYLDRYLKIPYEIGKYRANYLKINLIRKKVLDNIKTKKFCAAVISNHGKYYRFRLKFINELNKYKKVDMGGRYNNNVGTIKNKISFLSHYKFSIAMENCEGDGYFSEKMIDSFLSGTIPIYYGNYMVDEYINPKSYILIRGEKDMKKKIEYIIEIDKNEQLYKNIIKENILIDKNFKEKMEKQKTDFLFNIFEQDKNKAKRIDKY